MSKLMTARIKDDLYKRMQQHLDTVNWNSEPGQEIKMNCLLNFIIYQYFENIRHVNYYVNKKTTKELLGYYKRLKPPEKKKETSLRLRMNL